MATLFRCLAAPSFRWFARCLCCSYVGSLAEPLKLVRCFCCIGSLVLFTGELFGSQLDSLSEGTRVPSKHSLPSRVEEIIIIIIIHSFYMALFCALEQTYCAHWHVILNE